MLELLRAGGKMRTQAGFSERTPFRFARLMLQVSLSGMILRRYFRRTFPYFFYILSAPQNDELLQFERLITETEIEWMLKKKRVIPLAGIVSSA